MPAGGAPRYHESDEGLEDDPYAEYAQYENEFEDNP